MFGFENKNNECDYVVGVSAIICRLLHFAIHGLKNETHPLSMTEAKQLCDIIYNHCNHDDNYEMVPHSVNSYRDHETHMNIILS